MMASLSALSIAGLVYFAFGFGWEGFIGSPAHILTLSGKGWNWIAAEPFFFRKLALDGSPALSVRIAANFLRGPGGLDPARQRRGPLASSRERHFNRDSGRLDLPAFRALGLGRRLAGATWRQLRPWTRISRCGRSRHDSRRGRPYRVVGNLDSGPATREIFRRRHGSRDSRPQRGPDPVRLFAGSARMARAEFRWRDPVHSAGNLPDRR